MFRIGNTAMDHEKIGFSEKKIRMLQLNEEYIQVIRRDYEVKHNINIVANQTEIY